MAEQFLEDLYRIADAATSMEMTLNTYRFDVQDANINEIIQSYVTVFTKAADALIKNNDVRGVKLWESLERLSKYYTMVSILDEIEENCLPIVYSYIDEQPKIDVDDGNVRLRSSRAGFIYLSDINDSCDTYNSRINPMKEAYCIAKGIYHPSKYKFVFLGCGLGYIPYRLYLLSEGAIDIHIYFHNDKDYEYAKLYGVLSWIPEEILHVTVSNKLTDFLVCATDNCDEYFFYRPDINKYAKEDVNKIDIYVKSKNTEYLIDNQATDNFYRNIRYVDKFISRFDKSSLSDKIIIVAGGPSVDDNIDFLKNHKQNGMSIICVGTILKRLLSLNIIPDITVVCDPFNATERQYKDIEIDNVPVFLGLNTYWKIARDYPGDKYFVALDGTTGETLRYVKEHNEKILPAAATVTVMAFSVAAYLGAKEIYLVGADFAFPGTKSHASGTLFQHEVKNADMYLVDGVNGEVYTEPLMTGYRMQLEKQIINNKQIKVYNMSKSGAKIAGTYEDRNNYE